MHHEDDVEDNEEVVGVPENLIVGYPENKKKQSENIHDHIQRNAQAYFKREIIQTQKQ